ncbi:hypothetical protein C8F04DRAFT_609500 [Mycena alexandri]|uniref:Uncharacterized protein n=1 Tax=Mycena alexandri TaxID=1745969 RepID=A0AAD6SI91_9AGAR|nr:hypothetical protein C8F04DRAFT_91835 [Mycena alexandri]KAJ7033799.1 hypothetical protein C8F04DRAFT_609500 [Mycena alexandri]
MHFRDSLYWAAGSVWLSQANLIFHRLQVIDNYLNYVVITGVDFEVQILPISGRPPTGYLFLCPPSAFQTGSSSLSWPDSPAYWSLDPLGVERLTAEDATRLGFPSMLLTTSVLGYSWDASVYAGLRQFHAAKGFDPDSQDVARHLGYPLYEPTGEMDVPFAHSKLLLDQIGYFPRRYSVEDEEEVEDDPSDEEKCSGVEGLSDEEEHLSGVERGPSPEATTANPLESTEPFNILEPSMSHTFKIISSMKLVLILFLVLCQVYEAVG